MRITSATGERPGGQAGEVPASGPAVPRLVLGTRLRRLREAQFITAAEAADSLRAPEEHVTAMELGRSGFRPRDVADFLRIYGVTDEAERATLIALMEEANRPGWWHSYQDVVPAWLHTYLGMEEAAGVIRSYEVQFVPGLLQTPDYARAVIALRDDAGEPRAAERRERRLALRMRRQEILRGPRPPHLWAVIDEAALRRPIGGPEVMRAQLRHLVEVCELPHVTVQVMPFAAGGHPAAGGPVTLLRLPQSELPDVVYLEQLHGAHYPEDPADVERYRHVIDHLVTRAEPATRTRAFLERILDETATSRGRRGQ
ncbi:helix-turn-helix domain-containing protein [Streptomyces daliensis]|uniref:Helix-turn-helix domain-containing protein n=1 Tax=Streptomyces daliensis TaxID=299421 RepID=A0A8T4J028_9ACTN|nr:helix-turn-helix domain-containing protein [Streptomyces daliensis]